MFENDLYRRLVLKTQASNRKINTVKPWFPKQREKKEIKDEYKFFVLPPNKFNTLLKKQQIQVPSDEQIREFLRQHSLKHIVYYGESFHQPDIRLRPSPTVMNNTPRSHALAKQFQQSIKRRPLKLQQMKTSPPQKSTHSLTKYVKTTERSGDDLYKKLRRLNYSPQQALNSPLERRQQLRFDSPPQQPYIQTIEVPKSVLPNPPRSKKHLRTILLRALNRIKKLGVDIQFVMKNKVFSKKPYEKPLSKELIHATKKNGFEEVKNLLLINPYLVFDFDYYNMSALHWACKKGYSEIVDLLMSYHADIDAIDVLNRTPLILAIQGNYLEIVYQLLLHGAYPWSTPMSDLTSAVRQNPRVKPILTKARRLQIVSAWTQSQDFIQLM